MKVLITGASGRLAGFVIRELAKQHELVLTSRRKPAAEFSSFPWIQGDLNCFEDCQRAVQGVEAIQHLGAQPWPVDHPDSRARAEEQGIPFDATFKTNMLGTYYLMQAAVEAGVRIVVMAGSNCALGHGFRISDTPFPIQTLPVDETHPCYPEDSYSYSKRAGEDLLASYTRAYGIRTYVDEMDDAVNTAYAAAPTRLYLVGRDGKVAYAGGLGPFGFKPKELGRAIENYLAAETE